MSQQSKTIIQDMKIFVKNNDVNKALRILKKKMLNEGISKEVRERQYYTPKGESKRLAKKAGRKRWLKKRAQLEQRFIREEANQFRKNKRKNVQRSNQGSNKPRNFTRSSGNQGQRKSRS